MFIRHDWDNPFYRAGHVARANGIDRTENPFTDRDAEMAYLWDAGWVAHERACRSLGDRIPWPFEEGYQTSTGNIAIRLRSSVFYWGGLIAFIAGLVFNRGSEAVLGIAFTLALWLVLYPLIRYFFKGKGGLLPAILTVITGEVIKHLMFKALDRTSRKNRR